MSRGAGMKSSLGFYSAAQESNLQNLLHILTLSQDPHVDSKWITTSSLFAFNFNKPVWGFPRQNAEQSFHHNFLARQTFTAVLMLVSLKLFLSNCNKIRAPSCFHMIDERLKGLLRLKAHLAPHRGPISCPCAGSKTATMQMRGSLQRMPIMLDSWGQHNWGKKAITFNRAILFSQKTWCQYRSWRWGEKQEIDRNNGDTEKIFKR